MVLLLIYVATAVGFSFWCSILEGAFLSARLATLMERKEAGNRGAALLLQLKQQRVDDALSAILILNTVAHTAGATLAGTRAETLFGDKSLVLAGIAVPWVGLFAAALIVLILIGSEIVPKTLGVVYAPHLVGFTAFSVRALIWLFKPALLLTSQITNFLARNREVRPISRRELAAMVSAAARDGSLPAAEARVVSNVLRYHEIKLEDVMTPRTVIAMLPAATTIGRFLDDDNVRVYSRIPLYEGERDNVVGFVFQREVLAAAARGEPHDTPLARFARKALFMPERREHMALVTDEYGGIAGLVSLEDLMETTLGIEIIDESDRVADLRIEAVRVRDRRLQEIQEQREREAALVAAEIAPKDPV
jgi:CBS domain containing-hemolysin-like protein